jgi:hypothetical protein
VSLASPAEGRFHANTHVSRLTETIWHDLRHALRTARKNPLLRSLPVSDPAGLVVVQRTSASGKLAPIDARALDVIRGLTSTYRDAALSTALPFATVTIDNQPEPPRQVFAATAGFFSTPGLEAQAGRLSDGGPVAILSDRFWRTRFNRDRGAIGRAIVVNGDTYSIAGVTAPGFAGVSLDSRRGAATPRSRPWRARARSCLRFAPPAWIP